jgi:hypothetical protein
VTPAEATLRSRRAAGLPDHVINDQALDALAALLASIPTKALEGASGPPSVTRAA